MDKGIRVNVNNKFLELLPMRTNAAFATSPTKANTAFRKAVIAYAMEEFGITLASAATHYNHAFQEARKLTDPTVKELLVGLGRDEDKKGGRKPKAKIETVEGTEPVQTEFTVKKKSDGTIIAENISFEAAQELVAKAKAAKKAALYWV